eukprot:350085-Chlamydomonas_euryale.AAC.2
MTTSALAPPPLLVGLPNPACLRAACARLGGAACAWRSGDGGCRDTVSPFAHARKWGNGVTADSVS